MQMNSQFKIYPKVNEDIPHGFKPDQAKKISADGMSLPELVKLTRSFYVDSYLKVFDIVVKMIWLESKFMYNGARRSKRYANGNQVDSAYAFFKNAMVGVSPKFLTSLGSPPFLISYFKDFFPNFFNHNPFTEPEYYKYPYKHVTPDFLAVVKQHHDRLAMLEYADEKKMTIREFTDWAINQALCYNIEVDEEVYVISRDAEFSVFIRAVKK